ncbi:MAG: alpha-ribazole phosphatase [Chloroflexi bacterium]|nr:alpha-ribazole phosphatase [Chloroflexota bacterium]
MSRLFLVRHGDTESGSTLRYWGQSDVKLSTVGLRQAESLRTRLATERIDAIYTSNLRRASVTAETIASRHQLDIVRCDELNEVDFGKVEGLTFDEVSRFYPEVAKTWVSRSLSLEFPDGENFEKFNNRVSKFLSRLDKHTLEETILIVAHAGPLRLLVCHLLGLELRYWRQFRLDLASLSIIETYSQQAMLSLLNGVSHLE